MINNNSNFTAYHNAVIELIKSVFSGNVFLESVDTAYDNAIKQIKGKMTFPFISIYPTPTITLDNSKNSFPSYHRGDKMYTELPIYDDKGEYLGSDDRYAKNVKSLYINIEYQIDIWSIDRMTAEEVVRELMFWFYENQQVTINFYGQPLIFTFTISDTIQDNTDLVNYESNGKIYRFTTNIALSVALFRTENYFTVKKPIIDVGVTKVSNKVEGE